MTWRKPRLGSVKRRKPIGSVKYRKPAPVQTLWVGSASLYQTKDNEPIASITMSSIGHIIAWHEFVPRKITQQLPLIWSSAAAAELAVYAAHAEALHEKEKTGGGSCPA